MKITPNFNLSEFHSKDGTPYPMEWVESRLKPLCKALERIRKEVGAIHITSGFRSEKHNKKVGGAKNSQHVQGIAVDIVARSVTPKQLHDVILKLINDGEIPDGGLGLYKSWVHYDQRGSKARWRG